MAGKTEEAEIRSVLFSAEAMNLAEALADWVRRELKQTALLNARRDGRNVASEADVWRAYRAIDLEGAFVRKDVGPPGVG